MPRVQVCASVVWGAYTPCVRVRAPCVGVVHVPSLRVLEKVYVQELRVYTSVSVCSAPSVCVRKCARTACEWGVCVCCVSVQCAECEKVCTHGVYAWVQSVCTCVRACVWAGI